MNKNYFEERNKMKKRAQEHIKRISNNYRNEVNYSIENSIIYDDTNAVLNNVPTCDNTNISVIDADTVSTIFNIQDDSKITVLNFASYKNPGGMFIEGSSAQEESLCHFSTLYNVLISQSDYYKWNNLHKNRAMYHNRAIYSKDILFINNPYCAERYMIKKYCDVITCAAPNWGTASRYKMVSEEDNDKYLESRIEFVLKVAALNNTDTLILGAYGCGVFKQNPVTVALLFRLYLENEFKNVFKNVIFAIPKGVHQDNYKAFDNVFKLKV